MPAPPREPRRMPLGDRPGDTGTSAAGRQDETFAHLRSVDGDWALGKPPRDERAGCGPEALAQGIPRHQRLLRAPGKPPLDAARPKPLPDGIERGIQTLVRPGRLRRGAGEEIGLQSRLREPV